MNAEQRHVVQESRYLQFPAQHGKETFAINGQFHHTDTASSLLAGNTIFDPGSLQALPNLLRNIKQLGKSLSEPYTILITHLHADHCQSVAALVDIIKRRGGSAEVIVPVGVKDMIADGHPGNTAHILYPGTAFVPFSVDHEIRDGDVIERGQIAVQAIRAPGHSQHDTCYIVYDAGEKILVAGDALVGSILDEQPYGLHSNFDKHRESQLKLFTYDFDKIFEGHGWPTHMITKEVFRKRFLSAALTRGDMKPGGFAYFKTA